MKSKLNAYVSYKDNARAAMEFYQSVLGGELEINTFKDLHASQDPSEDDLVMHSTLTVDGEVLLMASDTPARMDFDRGNNSFSLSLSGKSDAQAELTGYFEKLSAGGTITMPLDKAIWGDTFGMCIDKFGIMWLVNIAGEQANQAQQ